MNVFRNGTFWLARQDLVTAICQYGVQEFNQTREEYPEWIPNLQQSRIVDCDWHNIDLHSAILPLSQFNNVVLEGSNLREVRMQCASFTDVSLSKAILQDARLQFCYFTDVVLDFANLQRADLQKCVFKDVSFLSANLRGADMERAYLRNVTLTDSDWRDTHRANVSIKDAVGIESMKLNKATLK